MTARSWWFIGAAALMGVAIYFGIWAIGLLNLIYAGGIR